MNLNRRLYLRDISRMTEMWSLTVELLEPIKKIRVLFLSSESHLCDVHLVPEIS